MIVIKRLFWKQSPTNPVLKLPTRRVKISVLQSAQSHRYPQRVQLCLMVFPLAQDGYWPSLRIKTQWDAHTCQIDSATPHLVWTKSQSIEDRFQIRAPPKAAFKEETGLESSESDDRVASPAAGTRRGDRVKSHRGVSPTCQGWRGEKVTASGEHPQLAEKRLHTSSWLPRPF